VIATLEFCFADSKAQTLSRYCGLLTFVALSKAWASKNEVHDAKTLLQATNLTRQNSEILPCYGSCRLHEPSPRLIRVSALKLVQPVP